MKNCIQDSNQLLDKLFSFIVLTSLSYVEGNTVKNLTKTSMALILVAKVYFWFETLINISRLDLNQQQFYNATALSLG